jgi:hypothetical protein
MAEILRTRLLSRRTSATEILPIDLPVNPISHLVLSVTGWNATDEATLAEIIAFVNSVKVIRGGVTVVNLESEDLYGLQTYLYRKRPTLTQMVATDNATRLLSLIIPFGRKLYDPAECLPAMPKGEQQVILDLTALGTSIDNGTISLDCVQLIGASPTQYLRATLKALAAPGGTGDYYQQIPLGNKIACIQMRMVTFPATSSNAYGIDAIATLIDEKERMVSAAGIEGLLGEMAVRQGAPGITIAAQGQLTPLNIAWLDFDPNGDSAYLLDTSGAKKAEVRLTYGVNEALNLSTFEIVPA